MHGREAEDPGTHLRMRGGARFEHGTSRTARRGFLVALGALSLAAVPGSSAFSVLPAARFGRMAGRIGAAGGRARVQTNTCLKMIKPPPPPPRGNKKAFEAAGIDKRQPPPPPPMAPRSSLVEMADDGSDPFFDNAKTPDQIREEKRKAKEMSGMFSADKKGNLKKMKFVYDHEVDDIEDDLANELWQTGAPDEEVRKWDEWRKRASDWMFFDQARIWVKGGDGGQGIVAMRREKYVDMGGPWGGSGGSGGNVIFETCAGDNTLARVRARQHVEAEGGQRGQGKGCHGYGGKDIRIEVPVGTLVLDEETQEVIADLSRPGERMVIARGGQGGRGNVALKTLQNPVPEFAELGEKGEGRWLNLQLKLVADVGIVGMPNAGKSTLIAAVTNAKPKVADYPFTTIVPNLGVCQLPGADCETLVLADIPGLIEGAHQGVGLGHAFLRHVERCRVLIHLVDGSAEDPVGNLKAIELELEMFNPDMAKKPKIVLVNKMDIPEVRAKWPTLREEIKQVVGHGRVDAVSAAANANLMETMRKIKSMVDKMPPEEVVEYDFRRDQELKQKDESTVRKLGKGSFEIVPSKNLRKAVEMTNWDYEEAIERFYRILVATGVRKLLTDAGAVEGDDVILEGYEFEFQDDSNLMELAAKEAGYMD